MSSVVMGDVSFGADVRFPGFAFSGAEISFDVLNDNIFEHTEEGELSFFPQPTSFDGHTPLFKSVRIAIKDDEGKFHTLTTTHL